MRERYSWVLESWGAFSPSRFRFRLLPFASSGEDFLPSLRDLCAALGSASIYNYLVSYKTILTGQRAGGEAGVKKGSKRHTGLAMSTEILDIFMYVLLK